MKKVLSFLILFSLLLSLCACGAETQQETQPTTEPTEVEQQENPFAGINELESVDGVYQIHSIQGLLNIANHLDGSFELLCDIDLGGIQWTPVGTKEAPFTGKINAQQHVISNFVVDTPTEDGYLGFFGYNEGNVRNLVLADMQITATENTVSVGAMAGVNAGTILRCTVGGTMNVQSGTAQMACGGIAGQNTARLESSVAGMEMCVTVPGEASVGGFVGIQAGGMLSESDFTGSLSVTSGSNKQVGLFAGQAEDLELLNNTFLGESNTVDGETYIQFCGQEENVTNTGYLLRDNTAEPLPAEIQALRDKVESQMRAMGTVEWTVAQNLTQTVGCTCCKAKMFMTGQTYRGIPYSHKGGSLDRFLYSLDENHVVADWAYELDGFDGWDLYIGNDCFGAIKLAWTTVSDSMNVRGTLYQLPVCGEGTVPVGDWEWELPISQTNYLTQPYVEATGEERLYEAYACLRKGDAVGNRLDIGGHTRLLACDAVVVRDAEGKIDPDKSYVLTHEQGGGGEETEAFSSSWRIDYKYSFDALAKSYYVPFTIPELLDGTTAPVTATLEGGVEGRSGLTTGVVMSNYFMDSVEMVITDAQGRQVFAHKMFANVDKTSDTGHDENVVKILVKDFNLARFAPALKGLALDPNGKYHCVITANLLTGDSLVVKDYTF